MHSVLMMTLVVGAAISAAPAQAQSGCELHFWGSDSAVTSTYSGVPGLAGALLSGPRPQSKTGLQSDLPPEAQAQALTKVDVAGLLKMPNVRLVEEKSPYQGKASRRGPRLTSSTAPCYAELIVDYIGYSSHITAGRKFGARFWLRRYPAGSTTAQVQNGGKNV